MGAYTSGVFNEQILLLRISAVRFSGVFDSWYLQCSKRELNNCHNSHYRFKASKNSAKM